MVLAIFANSMKVLRYLSVLIWALVLLPGCDFQYAKNKMEYPSYDAATNQTVLGAINEELKDRPNDGSLLKRKVRFLESAEWPEESIGTIEKALEALPDDGELHYIKARFHLAKKELTPAIIEMGRAGRLGYLTAEYFSVYARVLLRAGEIEEALKQANRFQQLDPDNYRSDYLKGRIYYELGDTTKALSSFTKAFERQSDDDDLNLLLMDVYLSRKDTASFNQIVRNSKTEDEEWLMKIGDLRRKYGDSNGALENFKEALNINPGHLEAMLSIANEYYGQSVYDSSIHYSRIAIGFDSLSLNARLIHARSYDNKYFYSEAIEEYQALLTIDSTYQNASSELKEVYRKVAYLRRLKEEKEAVPQFDFGPARKSTNSNN